MRDLLIDYFVPFPDHIDTTNVQVLTDTKYVQVLTGTKYVQVLTDTKYLQVDIDTKYIQVDIDTTKVQIELVKFLTMYLHVSRTRLDLAEHFSTQLTRESRFSLIVVVDEGSSRRWCW